MFFSDQEFEDCDAFPEDIEYIFRLDVKTGEVTHKVGVPILKKIFQSTSIKSEETSCIHLWQSTLDQDAWHAFLYE